MPSKVVFPPHPAAAAAAAAIAAAALRALPAGLLAVSFSGSFLEDERRVGDMSARSSVSRSLGVRGVRDLVPLYVLVRSRPEPDGLAALP